MALNKINVWMSIIQMPINTYWILTLFYMAIRITYDKL